MSGPGSSAILLEALADVTADMPEAERPPIEGSAVVFGAGAGLDSFTFVQFAIEAEARLEDRWGTRIELIDLLAGMDATREITLAEIARAVDEALAGTSPAAEAP